MKRLFSKFGRLRSRRSPAPKQSVHSEQLEQRVLFSADVPWASDVVAFVDARDRDSEDRSERTADVLAMDQSQQLPPLVVVDPGYEQDTGKEGRDLIALLRGVDSDMRIVDPGTDIVGQLSDLLGERKTVQNVHLFGSADATGFALGSDRFDTNFVLNRANDIAVWRNFLTPDSRFDFYSKESVDVEAWSHTRDLLSSLTGASFELHEPDAVGRLLTINSAQGNGGDGGTERPQTELDSTDSGKEGIDRSQVRSFNVNQQTVVVTSLSDTVNGDTSSMVNLTASDGGDGISLREAILALNEPTNGTGPHRIEFNLTGGGPHTIALTAALPEITAQVIIDGTTEPDFGGTPMVVLDGSALGVGTDALVLAAGSSGSTIRGLVINQFDGNAIDIRSGSNSNTIAGNYIGTDATGSVVYGNSSALVFIASDSNVIGGSTAADRNVISGGNNGVVISGGDLNQVSGNYIGSDATGNSVLSMVFDGVRLESGASNNTIGGATAAHGNVIVGVSADGIQVDGLGSDGNVLQQNLIGVSADGSNALGVGSDGIYISGSVDGTEVHDNWIAATGFAGIELFGAITNTIIQGNTIGTDATLSQDWGTAQTGIRLDGGVTNTTIGGTGVGEGNVIAHSGASSASSDGIGLGTDVTGNTIRGNSIFESSELGIDLNGDGATANDANDTDGGGNNTQNYATLSSAGIDGNGDFAYVIDTSSLTAGGGPYTIDFYANDDPDSGDVEGRRYLGSVTGVADGVVVSDVLSGITLAPGEHVVLTTTDNAGNTSEFSNDVQATVEPPYDLQVTSSTGGGLELNNDGGNDTYFVADDGGAILGGLDALTFELQFATDSTEEMSLVSYATATSADTFMVVIDSNGTLRVRLNDPILSVSSSVFDFNTLRDGQQHTFAFAWDNSAGDWTVFVDGVEVASGTGYQATETLYAGGTLMFGQEQDSVNGGFDTDQVFQGSLYNARFFSDVRTDAEISASYRSDMPYNETDMVAQWRFDALSVNGVVVEDVSGNNLTVNTVTGAGFIPSTPVLTLVVDETAIDGTVVGQVSAADVDRQERIDALLLADSSLIYSAETNMFYRRSSGAADFSTSQSNAVAFTLNGEAGQLASIRSAHEQQIIFNLLGGSDAYLGASDATVEGEWRWFDAALSDPPFWVGDDDGYAPNDAYSNWRSARPDGGSLQAALRIQGSDGTWDDETGSTSYFSVYQWDADAVLDQTDPLTYSIDSQTVAGAFAIDSDTGQITVADGTQLDYSDDDIHTIIVRTTDTNGYTYDESVTVSLRDVNPGSSAPTDLSSGIELNVDGGNDAYLISDTGLATSLSATTFEIQFAANDSPNETVFLSFNNATDDEFSIQLNNADGGLELDFGSGVTQHSTAIDYEQALIDGEFHSLAVTWDSTNGDWAVYIDGEYVDSGTGLNTGSALDTTNGRFVFGQEQDAPNAGYAAHQRFSGTIYDVRIWDEARTAAEISLNHRNALDVTPAQAATIGLVANWQMDGFDGSNQVVDIVSGNNLSVANVGAVAAAPITSYSNSTSGVTTSSNSITFSDDGLATGWLSQTNSTSLDSMGFADDYRVSFTVDNVTNYGFMIGLSESDAGAGQNDIDHAIYIDGLDVNTYVVNNGSTVFTLSNVVAAPGDVFSFYVHDGVIDYELNGVAFYSEAFTPTANTYLDTSFYSESSGGYSNQDDYTLSNISVTSVFSASTPVDDLHVSENANNGDRVGFVVAGEPDLSIDIVEDGLFNFAGASGLVNVANGQTIGGAGGSWTVVSGNVDIEGSVGRAPLGGTALGLDGTAPGAISQTVDTVAGRQYQVVFAMTGNYQGGTTLAELRLSASGQSQDFAMSVPTGWSLSDPMWENRSFTFTADGSSTDLQFASLSASGSYGAMISDVQVIEIPAAVSVILNNDSTLEYDAATGKFYRHVGSVTSWEDALLIAAATQVNGVGGSLVSIDSAYENEVVRQILGDSGWGTAWLGGSDRNMEGEWHWYDGTTEGEQFWLGDGSGSAQNGNYANFSTLQPDNSGDGDTLHMSAATGMWDDGGGDTSYIIEWDASQVLSSFTFTLTDDADGRFSIDASSGEITVADAYRLDYENAMSHDIDILVTDATGATRAQTMTITVDDAGDPTSSAPTDLTSGIELNSDGGNDAFFEADDGGAILGGTTSLTIEVNLTIDNSSGDSPHLFHYSVGGEDHEARAYLTSTNNLIFGIGGNVVLLDNVSDIVDGEQHSIAITWDNTNGDTALYIDGELRGSGTVSAGHTLGTSGNLTIGQGEPSSGRIAAQALHGTIYDVRIWDEVRSAAEIALNYQHALDVTPAQAAAIGLVANWQMELDGSNEIVDAVSGNNLNVAQVGDIRIWTNQVGGVTADGNTLTYVDDGAPELWGSQINSANMSTLGYTDDYTIRFTLDNDTNFAWTVGLGSTESSSSFDDPEFAIFVDHVGGVNEVDIRHNGVSVGTYNVDYAPGGEFGFYINGTTLEYQYNGVTFATDTITASTDWYIDTSFYVRTSDAVYDNQDDYSLSNFHVVDGNGTAVTGFTASTPTDNLHVAENTNDGNTVGYVIPTDPDAPQDVAYDGLFTEGGDGGGAAWTRYSSGQTFGGWTVTAGDVDLGRTIRQASPLGGYQVDLSGDIGSAGAVAQDLDTVVGRQYQVVFAVSGEWNSGPDLKELLVTAGGESVEFSITEPNGWSDSNVLWEQRSFTFTATDSTTALEFASLVSTGYGALIADVRVIEIPPAISAILNNDPTLEYDAATGKFYRFVNSPATFATASDDAIGSAVNGITGQLINIDSAYENELIRQYVLASGNEIWLGAEDNNLDGNWNWLSGNEVGEQFWTGGGAGNAVSGQYAPDIASYLSEGPDETRLRILSDGFWADHSASDNHAYVIEWDASEVLSNYTFALTDDAGGRFAIDDSTGEITVANGSLLDYESDMFHDIDVRVTDAAGNSYTETMTIAVDNVAEATATVPGAQNVDEDGTLTFTGATAVTVSDTLAGTDVRMRVTLSVDDGVLNLSGLAGITIVAGADGSGFLVIDGTESSINTALEGMTFVPEAGFSGSVSLSVTTTLFADVEALYGFDGNADNLSDSPTPDGVFIGDATTVTDSERGSVLSLDGDGDAVRVDGDFGQPQDVSISMWVNVSARDSSGAQYIHIGQALGIWTRPDGPHPEGVEAFVYDGTTYQTAGTTQNIVGTGWHHLAMTHDSAAQILRLYIDGVMVAEITTTGSVDYSGGVHTLIGGHPGGDPRDVTGMIDDTAVYSRALTAQEIAQLANAQPTAHIGPDLTQTFSDPNGDFTATNLLFIHDDFPAITGPGTISSLQLAADDNGSPIDFDLMVLRPDGSGGFSVVHRVALTDANITSTIDGIRTLDIGTLSVQAGDVLAHWSSVGAGSIPYSTGVGSTGWSTYTTGDLTVGSTVQESLDSSSARVYGLAVDFTPTLSASDQDTVAITVNAVNDAPTFDVGDGVATNFPSSASDSASELLLDNDGSLIVVGTSNDGGNNLTTVTRYLADGSLDLAFGTSGRATNAFGSSDSVGAGALQADGRILVAGGTDSDSYIARFNADGTIDNTFGTSGLVMLDLAGSSSDYFRDIIVQDDGKIIAVGYANNGDEEMTIVRLNADGGLDLTFNSTGFRILDVGTGDDRFSSVAVDRFGRIVAAGRSWNGTDYDAAVVRFNGDGSLDTNFDGDGIYVNDVSGGGFDGLEAVAIDASGRVVLGGTTSAGTTESLAMRLLDNGTLDTSFNGTGIAIISAGSPHESIEALAIQEDGSIVLAGSAFTSSTSNDISVIRLTENGVLDTSFDVDGRVRLPIGSGNVTDDVSAVVIDHAGNIVVAGRTDGANVGFHVTRFDSSGQQDRAFNSVNTLDNAPSFVEGGAAVTLDDDVQVFDAELSVSDDFGGATLTLARDGGANSEDVFSATGNLVFNGGILELSSTPIGTYTNTGGQLVITFGAGANNADVIETMRSIQYSNSSTTPPASVQINWTFSDGNVTAQGSGGAQEATGSTTVTIQNTSNLSITAPATATTDEDTPFVFDGVNVVSIDDGIAGDNLVRVTLFVGDGTLTLASLANITIVGGADGAGRIVLEGLESDINVALNGLEFTPGLDFNGLIDLDVTVSIAADLSALYDFESGASDASDGTSYDGTLGGNASIVNDGTRGNVLSLDGFGDFVEIDGHIGEPASLTYAAWINATAVDTNGAVVLSAGGAPALYLGNDGALVAYFNDGSTVAIYTTENLVNTGWRHVAMTVDTVAQELTVFIDGVAIETVSATGSIIYGPSANTQIGRNGDGGAGFDFTGRIDDARVYARALSAEEIATLATDQETSSETVSITVNAVNDAPTFDQPGYGVFTAGRTGYNQNVDQYVLADGSILITPYDSNLNGALVRLLPDGTIDTSFGTNGYADTSMMSYIRSVTVQSNGQILIGGGASGDAAMVRYNADGSLDTSFGTGGLATFTGAGNDKINDIVVHTDGSITVVGDDGSNSMVARFNSMGVLENGFGTNGVATFNLGSSFEEFTSVLVLSDGRVVAGGESSVILLNTSGGLDSSFDGDGILNPGHNVTGLMLQADGQIVATGFSDESLAVSRFNTNGVLDASFGDDGLMLWDDPNGDSAEGRAIAQQSDGRLVVGGFTGDYPSEWVVLRLNTDGTLDTSFSDDGVWMTEGSVDYSELYSVSIFDDGGTDKIVLGGNSTIFNTGAQSTVVRLNPDGSLDTSLNTGPLDGNPTFVEGGTAVTLDEDVTIFDRELTNDLLDDFGGATLTLVRNGGANADDVFTATGNLVFNAGTLELSGSNIGTYTNVGGQLVLTFASGTENAEVNEVMQSIQYSNASDTPPASVQINWTFDDGNVTAQGSGGAESVTGSTTVNITATNDAPVLGNNTLTISEGGTVVLDASDLSATDAETAAGSLQFSVSGVTNGQFELVASPGVAITSFTQAQIIAGAVQFVHDGGEAAPTYSVSVSDGSLSDGPEAATITFSNVNDAPVIGNNSLTINEGGTVVLDASDLSATDVETAAGALQFTVSSVTNGQFELVASPGAAITSFTQAQIIAGAVQFVHNGGEAAPTYSVTVSDGSSSDGPDAATITFSNINDAPVIGNNSLTINEGGTVVLDGSDLSATDDDTAAGSLQFTVSSVTNGQFELVASPGAPITSFTQAQIIAGAVQFVHDGSEAAPTYSVTVSDGSLSDGPEAATITFSNVNDAPVIGNNSLTISEGGTVVLDGSDLSATDAETAAGSLQFTVSSVTNGQFELVASPGAAITSFTQAQIIAGAVQFVHDGGEDAPTYSVTVSDGSLSDGPEAATVTFSNVNDAPELVNNALTISEAGTVILDGSDLSATDAETAEGSLQFTVSSVTNGQFELVASPGAAITSFTQAQIIAGAVQFVHNGSEAAPTYSVTVSDGSLSDGPEAATITFSNVDDAPVIGNNSLTISEGGTVVLDGSDLSASDAETAAGSLQFTVSGVTNGQFELVASPGAAITTFTQAQIIAGAVQFVHDGGEDASTYSVTVSDGSLSDGPEAAAITFTNLNDAPVIGNNSLTISEAGTVILDGSDLSATDAETAAGSLQFTVSGVTNGQFELVANPGAAITTFTQAQITSGAVQFVHDGGEDAPTYSVTVSDGSLTDGPEAATITFSNINDAPVIGNNSLTISEAGTVILDGSDMSATDAETVAGSLQFTVSSVTNGQFELVASPGAAITTFTQAQITSGAVQFVHDGGEDAPTYSVTVSDGSLTDGPEAATITFTNVNDAPVIGNNSLTISEGGTVVLGVSDLSASDAETAAGSLQFTVSGVTNGQFELVASPGAAITTFTQAQITSGAVQFVHDGSENAPTYSVTVSDGSLTDGPQAATITFNGVNDAPALANNSLTISEAGTVVLDGSDLSATDTETAAGSLQFTVSGVTNGQFELVASPGAAITTFTQAQITSGAVQFVHDGGEDAPTYSVTVSDGSLSDGPEAATITFSNVNDAPVIGNNSLTISEGGTVVLDGSDLSATDAETAAGSLQFTVSGVTNGQFELVASPGVAITTFTQAQITSGAVQFVHDGGEDAPTYSVTVSDGSLSDGPEAATITFTNVNDAPVIGNNSLTISEAGTVILDGSDLSATDAETAAGSLQFTVSGVTNGQFEFVASPGAAITTFTQAQITSGAVQFVHDGGEDAPTYSVTVSDGSLSDGPEAATITFTNVNDAPVIGNNSLTIGEGGTVVLDGSDLSATDAESAAGSLQFTVSSVTNGQFELVASPGAAITAFTQAQITSGAVQFVHDGGEDAPTYSVTVSDGSLSDGPEAATITFTNINDAPVIGNNSLTISEGSTTVLDASDLSASDAETAAGSLQFTVSSVTNGQFELVASPGAAITTFTQAQITAGAVQFVHNGGEDAPTYSVTVSDGSLTDGPEAATITFTNANDAPVIGNNSLTIDEGGTVVLDGSDLSASDAETAADSLQFTVSSVTNGQFELVASPGAAITTFTQAQITSGAVQFVHDGGEAAPTYSVTVSDGSLTDGPEAATITFSNVNDAPELANNSLTISEAGTVILDGSDLSATDAETAAGSLQFAVSGVTNGQFELVASPGVAITTFTQAQITAGAVQFVHDGGEDAPTYSVTVSDGSLSDGPEAATITFANVNDAPVLGNNSLTVAEGGAVVLSGSDLSASDIDAAAGALQFTVSGVTGGQFELVAAPGVAIATFTQAQVLAGDVRFVHYGGEQAPAYSVSVSDGSLVDGPQAATITFTNNNDAPVVSSVEGTTLAYIENDGAVQITSALSLSDSDDVNLERATVRIAGNYVNGEDVLSFVDQNGITGSWDATTGTLTLTGTSSVANYQAALRSVTFENVSDDPNTLGRTIVFVVNDGDVDSNSQARNVSLAAVNDAPATSSVTLAAIAEDSGPQTITQAQLLASATDVDNTSLMATSLAISSGGGVLVDNLDGTWTYTPALNDDSAVTFSYVVTDGSLNVAGSANLDLVPVNDTPELTRNALTISVDQTVVLDASNLAALDVDSAPGSLVFILSDVRGGQFELVTNPGVAVTSFTQAQVANGQVQFMHTAGAGVPAFTTQVSDGLATSAPQAAAITFNFSNTPPVLIADISSAQENQTRAGRLTATDVDGDPLSFAIVGGDDAASFELDAQSGDLSFRSAPDYEAPFDANEDGIYELSVQVSDGEGGITQTSLSIEIVNANDAPVADDAAFVVPTENAFGMIAQLSASDEDVSDQLTFALVGDPTVSDWFEIDSSSGEISGRSNQMLAGEYDLQVQVTDQAGVSTTAVVKVTVLPNQSVSNSSITIPGGSTSKPAISAPVNSGSDSDTDDAASDSEPTAEQETESVATDELDESLTRPDALNDEIDIPLFIELRGNVETQSLTGQVDADATARRELEIGSDPSSRYVEQRGLTIYIENLLSVFDVGGLDDLGAVFDSVTINVPPDLVLALDKMVANGEELSEQIDLRVSGAVVGSIAMSAGFLIWLLRAGTLLGSMLASRPLWTTIDPLPIFWNDDEGQDQN